MRAVLAITMTTEDDMTERKGLGLTDTVTGMKTSDTHGVADLAHVLHGRMGATGNITDDLAPVQGTGIWKGNIRTSGGV